LYLVATPIGNLDDISARAVEVLDQVDIIAAEDTRHSKRLLNHYGIRTRLQAYHEHNEIQQSAILIENLRKGSSIALISDAGTPLVSDPGYRLVESAHAAGIRVVPIPGACAAISALSAAGLPTDRFVFEGFPPAKTAARIRYLTTLQHEQRTLVFYESCHRISESLRDMAQVFGANRPATLAREITKTFETIRKSELGELSDWVAQDADQQKGEIVLVVAGHSAVAEDGTTAGLDAMLQVLIEELSLKQAAAIASKLTGIGRNITYKRALELKA
jgi:16S rRNA (cytidine1402-2'-O)-methyltransferase